MKKRIQKLLKESDFKKAPNGSWDRQKGRRSATFYWQEGNKENFVAYFCWDNQTRWEIEASPSSEFAERFMLLAISALNAEFLK